VWSGRRTDSPLFSQPFLLADIAFSVLQSLVNPLRSLGEFRIALLSKGRDFKEKKKKEKLGLSNLCVA